MVINVSSDAAVNGYPGWGAYSAAKAGMDGLTRVWAAELAGSGVTVVSVDPGDMDTEMHRAALPEDDPAALARPAEVAEAFVRLVAVPTEIPPLPPTLRASRPAEQRGVRRDHVRLLVIDRAADTVHHSRFDQLVEFLGPGDLLVVNKSRVLPAAVGAVRSAGEALQLRLCVRKAGLWDALAVQPRAPFANVPLIESETLRIGETPVQVLGRRFDIPLVWRLRVDADDDLDLVLRHGEPIRYSYVPEPVPLDAYQTVYATHPGSAEAPSAGRPLTWEFLAGLRRHGIGLADLVLHAGLSSFQDDDLDAEHHLFEEWFEIGPETARAVNRANGVVAAGTTVVRALETAATWEGRVLPAGGWTMLAIRPDRPPKAVDALLTGLHEPQASHFDLLRAFVSDALLHKAYAETVEGGYLWHEFGDSALIL